MLRDIHYDGTITWINEVLKSYNLKFTNKNAVIIIGKENNSVDNYFIFKTMPLIQSSYYKYHFNTDKYFGPISPGDDSREKISDRELNSAVANIRSAITAPRASTWYCERALRNIGIGMHCLQDIHSHQEYGMKPHPRDKMYHLAETPKRHITRPNWPNYHRPDIASDWYDDVKLAEFFTKVYFVNFLKRIPPNNPCICQIGGGPITSIP